MTSKLTAICVLITGLSLLVAGVAGVGVRASSDSTSVPVVLWIGLGCVGVALTVLALILLSKMARHH